MYLEISRQNPIRLAPISFSCFSTRPTGPEMLIAAIADPVRSKMGAPMQVTPGSFGSCSKAQPHCLSVSCSFLTFPESVGLHYLTEAVPSGQRDDGIMPFPS